MNLAREVASRARSLRPGPAEGPPADQVSPATTDDRGAAAMRSRQDDAAGWVASAVYRRCRTSTAPHASPSSAQMGSILPVNLRRGPSLARTLPIVLTALLGLTAAMPALADTPTPTPTPTAVPTPTPPPPPPLSVSLSQQAISYNATTNAVQVQVTATPANVVAPWSYVFAVGGVGVTSGSSSAASVAALLTTNCSITIQSVTVTITDASGATASAAGTLNRSLCPPPPNLPHAGDHIIASPNLSEALFIDRLRAVGSPALPEGHQIYQTLIAAGVNVAFALGTFQAESGSGTKGYAVTTKNWGNILYYAWEVPYGAVPYSPGNGYTYAKYPSWTASVQAYAHLLTVYDAAGYITVSSASAHWLGTIEGSSRHLTYLNNITAVMSLLLNASGATYVALNPARLLDTRTGNGLSGSFKSGVPRTFQVTGRGGVPTGAVAVTGTLTVTGQTSAGYVALGPVATATPSSSTLNFPRGDTRATGLTVSLGSGGKLSAVFNGGGGATTALVFDVTGYFVPGTSGATYVALNPARLLDTRTGNGLSGSFKSGVPRTFQVTGRGGVPTGAVAVTGTLTVTGQTSAGYVALGPVATATPSSSTLNFPRGDTRATGLTVSLGSGGKLSAVFNGGGGATTALVFDVTGYFVPGTSGATYVALNPARLLDTRTGNGLSGSFKSGVPRTFQVTGRGGVPTGAVAVTGTLTVTGQTSAGYVALGPVATATPSSSTLNFPRGDTRATGLTVSLGSGGKLSAVFNGGGGATTALVFDVTGYFQP